MANPPDITLYTAATPNGWKVSIALEELGVSYRVRNVDLFNGEQKLPAFLSLNPNGRIPVIIDHTQGDLVLFESGAILWYLAEKYGALIPEGVASRAQCHQWLMFQMSGVGPMMGQLNVFRHYFPVKLPDAVERYHVETERLFGVLDGVLNSREFLVDEHSVADIAVWSWVYTHRWSGISLEQFPALMAWKRRLRARPAYRRGVAVPMPIGRVLDTDGKVPDAYAKAAGTLIETKNNGDSGG